MPGFCRASPDSMGENLGQPGSSAAHRDNLASLLDMAAGMTGVSVWHLWGLWLWRHISTEHPLSSSQMGHLCSEGDIRLEKQTLEMRD